MYTEFYIHTYICIDMHMSSIGGNYNELWELLLRCLLLTIERINKRKYWS